VSRALETYLVKLYLDRDARRAFLERVDADGLALAARSLARKGAVAPRRSGWARLWALVRRLR
jgi:hypothetical protein